MAKSETSLHCQNCGTQITGQEKTFYGNVLCGEECREKLAARLYFRDGPPEPGSTWFCPHCAAENPLGDPREDLRPACVSCAKPLDPNSAAPPKGKNGCLVPLMLLPLGALASHWLLG
jgi:hypothetical protein